jgi:hypothetical protein
MGRSYSDLDLLMMRMKKPLPGARNHRFTLTPEESGIKGFRMHIKQRLLVEWKALLRDEE